MKTSKSKKLLTSKCNCPEDVCYSEPQEQAKWATAFWLCEICSPDGLKEPGKGLKEGSVVSGFLLVSWLGPQVSQFSCGFATNIIKATLEKCNDWGSGSGKPGQLKLGKWRQYWSAVGSGFCKMTCNVKMRRFLANTLLVSKLLAQWTASTERETWDL